MCGRFSLQCPAHQLPLPLRNVLPQDHRRHYSPRSLVKPSEPVLALVQEEGVQRAALLLWGLVPSWAKHPTHGPRPINARSETVAEKPSFRGAWRHRRCLIPATAFFEKRHCFRPSQGGVFWLAGLWERWLGADGSELDTCTVLTTSPNALVAPWHPRMPVLIPEGLEQSWLAPVHGAELKALEGLLLPWSPEGWCHDGPASRAMPSNALQGSLF
ncbi:MAG: SOS response-associated peptidase [Synechococcus sp.]